MAFHKNSDAFTRYTQQTLDELVKPYEEIAWSEWKEGEEPPDFYEDTKNTIIFITLILGAIDKYLSDDEAAFYTDVANVFPNTLATNYRTMGESLRSLVEKYKDYDWYPGGLKINYLQKYDRKNGTQFAEKARTFLFRYANMLAKADGGITGDEETKLKKIADKIYGRYDHPGSLEFLQEAIKIVDTLIGPYEEIALTKKKPGDPKPIGVDDISGDLMFIGSYFSELEKVVSDNEAAFINEVIHYLHYYKPNTFTKEENGEFYRQRQAKRPAPQKKEWLPPNCLDYLNEYDLKHGTHLSLSMKELALKFADAIIHANGNPTAKQLSEFELFKRAMDPTIPVDNSPAEKDELLPTMDETEFDRYIESSFEKFTAPMEEVILDLYKKDDLDLEKWGNLIGENNTIDKIALKNRIRLNFAMRFLQAGNFDNNISQEEAVFYNKHFQSLDKHKSKDELSAWYKQLLELATTKKNVNEKTPSWKISGDYFIDFLKLYDSKHDTHYADDACEFIIRYTEGIIKADGIITKEEEEKFIGHEKKFNNLKALQPGGSSNRQHHNNDKIIDETEPTLDDFIIPIETIVGENVKRGLRLPKLILKDDTQEPDGRKIIAADLILMGNYFGAIDNELSEDEASFIVNLDLLHSQDELQKLRSSSEIKEFYKSWYERIGKANSHLKYSLELPMTIKFLREYDKHHDTRFAQKAKKFFLDYANRFILVDGKTTTEEQTGLKRYSDSLDVDELMDELNKLIGLDGVKNDVSQLINFVKVQQIRQINALGTQPISRHLVFYGNPGTGKTTVARLISKLYKAIGILKTGHLIETDRSGLCAIYLGQTASKVKGVVESALGGVLFIDEAYSLVVEGYKGDFGTEAIDTLLKLMEDHRDDLVVVVAGYTDKMNMFLASNPGLKSRFNKFIKFDDYTPEQLTRIFIFYCNNSGYRVTEATRRNLLRLFSVLYESRDETFGNARLARNIFEKAINNHANRIVSIANIDQEILSTLESADIPGMDELVTI